MQAGFLVARSGKFFDHLNRNVGVPEDFTLFFSHRECVKSVSLFHYRGMVPPYYRSRLRRAQIREMAAWSHIFLNQIDGLSKFVYFSNVKCCF